MLGSFKGLGLHIIISFLFTGVLLFTSPHSLAQSSNFSIPYLENPAFEAPDIIDLYRFQPHSISDFNLSHSKKLVLTFDDGPNTNTSSVLETLRSYNIKATFFILGQNVNSRTEPILRRMQQDGHIVANHTIRHDNLRSHSRYTNPHNLIQEIFQAHHRIAPFQSPSHRLYFRAPYGAWTSAHASTLNNADPILASYIGPIFWTIGGETQFSNGQIRSAADWHCWSQRLSISTCAEGYYQESITRGGGVVLMHDVHRNTAEMLKELIPRWIRAGFEFVTLDDLRSLDHYQ